MAFNVGGPELLIFGPVLSALSVLTLLPGLLALWRRRLHAGRIFAVNVRLGWTVIGWWGALVWALLAPPDRSD